MAVGTLIGTVQVQGASPLFTFGFNDLNGSYSFDGSGGTLSIEPTAIADGGPFDSAGDVTRVFEPEETADYDAGFVALGTMANFLVTMDISGVTSSTASAVGSFTVMDTNGDQLVGDFAGSWFALGSFGTFDGLAQNVEFLSASGDGIFNGPGGGSFDMNIPFGPIYEGAFLSLETGVWFNESFDTADFQVTASFVPEPATMVMLLTGVLAVFRRRN
jgi:hypothetical protein